MLSILNLKMSTLMLQDIFCTLKTIQINHRQYKKKNTKKTATTDIPKTLVALYLQSIGPNDLYDCPDGSFSHYSLTLWRSTFCTQTHNALLHMHAET